MNNQLLSIIIANYNGEQYLPTCLNSVLHSTYSNFELLITDDGSTDKSIEIINGYLNTDQRIKLIRNQDNLGASASRNRAIKIAKGELLLFLDNDTEVAPSAIEKLVNTLQANESLGGAQALLLDFEKRDLVQNAGVKLWAQTGWGLMAGQWQENKGQYKQTDIIAISACLAVKKSVMTIVGDFDEKEAVVTEDLDLSWRIWIAGYSIVLVPDALVYHWTKSVDMRSNMHHNLEKIYFHLTKNSLVSILKNYELPNAIYYFFYSLVISGGRAILVLTRRQEASALMGTLRGILWTVFNLNYIIQKRVKVQRTRKISDKELFQRIIIKDSISNIYKKYFNQAGLL